MDTDKDMLKLSNEEPNISYSPIHDKENSSILSTSDKYPSYITPSLPLLMETSPFPDPLTKGYILIFSLEAKNYMKYYELNMKNNEYDTRFIDHNGMIVTRMDVKSTVRLYCLTK